MKTLKRTCILAATLGTMICLAACSKLEGYQLKKIVDQCGGADKVHSAWYNAGHAKAYCVDGRKVGIGDE